MVHAYERVSKLLASTWIENATKEINKNNKCFTYLIFDFLQSKEKYEYKPIKIFPNFVNGT